MIPKIIHYCWFGRNPMPELAEKCIKSWKKYCPDFEIIQWNEDNFDISACPLYVRQAYEHKKWAFVTDYVRLKVVYDQGGVYLDTDVELRKKLDPLLKWKAYFGFGEQGKVGTGLGFGAEKGAPILEELMADYEGVPFVLEDGSFDRTTCPNRNTPVFKRHGLRTDNTYQELPGSIAVLPMEYLCPIDYDTGIKKLTPNTISIHWFSGSWSTTEEQELQRKKQKRNRSWQAKDRLIHLPNRVLRKLLGNERYEKLKLILKR